MPTDPLFTAVQSALAGQFSLERELGRGGMGVVYLAREVELDRHVALKVLPPAIADRETRDRFLREARVAASLSHPSIVAIHRVGEAGDVVYFSMAYVDGGTLGDRLRERGPLAPSAATKLLREIAQALAYAHGRGLIHRDIKPDNILLDRESGRAMVSDFGIAAHAGDSAGLAAGTAHFMSPEQASGAAMDERSDIYSLGVVGYLALSGKLPDANSSLASAAPSTPRNLVTAIDRATLPRASERFATAEGFANALESRIAERAKLPEPVRAWMQERDPWTVPYIMWSLLSVGSAFVASGSADLPWSTTLTLLAMVPLPIVPAVLFQLRKARRLFEMGYSVDDLRAAFDLWHAERNEEIAEHSKPRTRLVHTVARIAAAAPIAGLTALLLSDRPMRVAMPGTNTALMPFIMAAAMASIPLMNALGIPMLPPAVRSRDLPIAEWFWDSRVGRWMERVLMRGRARAVPAATFRPTESLLASAIGDLYASLPTAYRSALPDVPVVIERLEAHARAARESLAQLEGVTAVDRDTQLRVAREAARRQLRDSVGAIEAIRLDLLRLMGGDADLAPTTTVIAAAREVDNDLSRLRVAQTEAGITPRPLGLTIRANSPA
ncbi:MAG TPA: serine/threonine-protein kinase [Gemmatimonadaceae bacterium]|nr:serine/threonine-protein kinase [Gemmatimonadaceae bacterium]